MLSRPGKSDSRDLLAGSCCLPISSSLDCLFDMLEAVLADWGYPQHHSMSYRWFYIKGLALLDIHFALNISATIFWPWLLFHLYIGWLCELWVFTKCPDISVFISMSVRLLSISWSIFSPSLGACSVCTPPFPPVPTPHVLYDTSAVHRSPPLVWFDRWVAKKLWPCSTLRCYLSYQYIP